MTTDQPTVFVVDDDGAVRDALQVLFKSVGIRSRAYATADEFHADFDHECPGCLVLDIRMPGMGGFELQELLNAKEIAPPIIMMSGHGDIGMAMNALQAGAIDFIEKPVRACILIERVRTAFERDAEARRRRAQGAATKRHLATLSPREREILNMVVAGMHNKKIAIQLGISHKTVETHRTSIMRKTKAQTVVDLVQMVSIVSAHSG